MNLLDRVRQTIRQHDLARPETRVLVALSGGSDSVALAHLLQALDAGGELRGVGLAHFNHQLRASAADDERFCERVAETLGWPLLVDREDVAARARRERRSLEDAARTARHEFLERARVQVAADRVALGHTRDDQAETFLLRLLRGAGTRGLAGMHPRRGAIIRPLLDCRRAELTSYLDAHQLAYVSDESNQDVNIPRNRVRAELLPMLEQRFNPAIVDVLADEADLARQEWLWMSAAAEALSAETCRREGDTWRIDAAVLAAAPVALARMLLHRVMAEASQGRPVSFAHVEQALGLVRASGPPADLPGQRLERIGPDLVLTSKPASGADRSSGRGPVNNGVAANLFRYPLSIPGEVRLAEAGCVVSVEVASVAHTADAVLGRPASTTTAVIRSDRINGHLAVRNRRPGDRFRPLGLAGRKKLQDYFVDRKVVRRDRDRVPLVVDEGEESDRIVWVAGHSIDAEFRVTDPAQAMLFLRLRQV